jgi:S-adenosylmethionine:tRNA-ribosyltransferase-isomerase (queuine synthetase)
MKEIDLELYSYNLPKEKIADKPAKPRDFSKLFVYDTLKIKFILTFF